MRCRFVGAESLDFRLLVQPRTRRTISSSDRDVCAFENTLQFRWVFERSMSISRFCSPSSLSEPAGMSARVTPARRRNRPFGKGHSIPPVLRFLNMFISVRFNSLRGKICNGATGVDGSLCTLSNGLANMEIVRSSVSRFCSLISAC